MIVEVISTSNIDASALSFAAIAFSRASFWDWLGCWGGLCSSDNWSLVRPLNFARLRVLTPFDGRTLNDSVHCKVASMKNVRVKGMIISSVLLVLENWAGLRWRLMSTRVNLYWYLVGQVGTWLLQKLLTMVTVVLRVSLSVTVPVKLCLQMPDSWKFFDFQMSQLLITSLSICLLTAFLWQHCCTDGVQLLLFKYVGHKKNWECFSFFPLTVHDGFLSRELNLILIRIKFQNFWWKWECSSQPKMTEYYFERYDHIIHRVFTNMNGHSLHRDILVKSFDSHNLWWILSLWWDITTIPTYLNFASLRVND